MTVVERHLQPGIRGGDSALSHAERRHARDAARDLAAVLQRRTRAEVRFDSASRALYATDLSIYRQWPVSVDREVDAGIS